MKKHYRLLLLLLLITEQGWADQYAVQLEASKSPSLERYEALSVHGNLYTVSGDNGFIRARLGPYESKDRALDILRDVRAAGYTDAFIARQQSSDVTKPSMESKRTKHEHDSKIFDVRTSKEWKMLTPEQQANAVYLDGVLHVKDGDQFISLDEITRE
jgi:hypothetical protein